MFDTEQQPTNWGKHLLSCSTSVYCRAKISNITANMCFLILSFFLQLSFPIVLQKLLLLKEAFLYYSVNK